MCSFVIISMVCVCLCVHTLCEVCVHVILCGDELTTLDYCMFMIVIYCLCG